MGDTQFSTMFSILVMKFKVAKEKNESLHKIVNENISKYIDSVNKYNTVATTKITPKHKLLFYGGFDSFDEFILGVSIKMVDVLVDKYREYKNDNEHLENYNNQVISDTNDVNSKIKIIEEKRVYPKKYYNIEEQERKAKQEQELLEQEQEKQKLLELKQKEQQRQEQLEKQKRKKEQERLEQERERLEQERNKQKLLEQKQKLLEQKEQEKLKKEKLEKEKLEKEQEQKQKLLEQKEQEKSKKEKLEKEKLEKERLERKKQEREKQKLLEQELLEQRLLEQNLLEQNLLEQKRAEQKLVEQEKLEEERIKKINETTIIKKLEEERLKREKLEKERLEREKLEKERLKREKLEKERLEREKLEKERLEREKLEKERLEREKLERLEKLEKDRLEKLEKERLEKLEKERLEKLEKERLEKLEKERLEKLEKERLEREKLEKERLEKLEKERLEKLEKERLEKLEKERLEREKLEKERLVKSGLIKKYLDVHNNEVKQSNQLINKTRSREKIIFSENIENKLIRQLRFYMHASFDEFMPEAGNSNVLPLMIDLLNGVKDIIMSNFNIDNTKYDELINVYTNKVRITGFTKHAISYVFDNDALKIVLVNSGLGCSYGPIDFNKDDEARICTIFTFNDINKFNAAEHIIMLAHSKQTFHKTDVNYYYGIVVPAIKSLSNDKGTKTVDLQGKRFKMQKSGSCTFFSALYPLLYILDKIGIDYDFNKFLKFEYEISLHIMEKILPQYVSIYYNDMFIIREFVKMKLYLINKKFPKLVETLSILHHYDELNYDVPNVFFDITPTDYRSVDDKGTLYDEITNQLMSATYNLQDSKMFAYDYVNIVQELNKRTLFDGLAHFVAKHRKMGTHYENMIDAHMFINKVLIWIEICIVKYDATQQLTEEQIVKALSNLTFLLEKCVDLMKDISNVYGCYIYHSFNYGIISFWMLAFLISKEKLIVSNEGNIYNHGAYKYLDEGTTSVFYKNEKERLRTIRGDVDKFELYVVNIKKDEMVSVINDNVKTEDMVTNNFYVGSLCGYMGTLPPNAQIKSNIALIAKFYNKIIMRTCYSMGVSNYENTQIINIIPSDVDPIYIENGNITSNHNNNNYQHDTTGRFYDLLEKFNMMLVQINYVNNFKNINVHDIFGFNYIDYKQGYISTYDFTPDDDFIINTQYINIISLTGILNKIKNMKFANDATLNVLLLIYCLAHLKKIINDQFLKLIIDILNTIDTTSNDTILNFYKICLSRLVTNVSISKEEIIKLNYYLFILPKYKTDTKYFVLNITNRTNKANYVNKIPDKNQEYYNVINNLSLTFMLLNHNDKVAFYNIVPSVFTNKKYELTGGYYGEAKIYYYDDNGITGYSDKIVSSCSVYHFITRNLYRDNLCNCYFYNIGNNIVKLRDDYIDFYRFKKNDDNTLSYIDNDGVHHQVVIFCNGRTNSLLPSQLEFWYKINDDIIGILSNHIKIKITNNYNHTIQVDDKKYNLLTMRGNSFYCYDRNKIPKYVLECADGMYNTYIAELDGSHYVIMINNNQLQFKKSEKKYGMSVILGDETDVKNVNKSNYAHVIIKILSDGQLDFDNCVYNFDLCATKLQPNVTAMWLYFSQAVQFNNISVISKFGDKMKNYPHDDELILNIESLLIPDVMSEYVVSFLRSTNYDDKNYPSKYKTLKMFDNKLQYCELWSATIGKEELNFDKLPDIELYKKNDEKKTPVLKFMDKSVDGSINKLVFNSVATDNNPMDGGFKGQFESTIDVSITTSYGYYIDNKKPIDTRITIGDNYSKLHFYFIMYDNLLNGGINREHNNAIMNELVQFYDTFKENFDVKWDRGKRTELCKILSIEDDNDDGDIRKKIYDSMKYYLMYNQMYTYENSNKINEHIALELKKLLLYKKQQYVDKYYYDFNDDMKFIYSYKGPQKKEIFELLFLSNINNKHNNPSTNSEFEYNNVPQYFNNPELLDERYVGYVVIYEYLFGNFLQCLQLKMLSDLILDSNRKQRKVRQLVMGSGKSSVIAPLISIINICEKKNIMLHCMPANLTFQSFNTFNKYISMFVKSISVGGSKHVNDIMLRLIEEGKQIDTYQGNVYIVSDNLIKRTILTYSNAKMLQNDDQHGLKLNENVCAVFDEIHELGDNRISEMNLSLSSEVLPRNEITRLYENAKSIIDKYYLSTNPIINDDIGYDPHFWLKDKIKTKIIIDDIGDHQYNFGDMKDTFVNFLASKRAGLNFGLRIGEQYGNYESFIAVPYAGSQTPRLTTTFVDIKATILLTTLIYNIPDHHIYDKIWDKFVKYLLEQDKSAPDEYYENILLNLRKYMTIDTINGIIEEYPKKSLVKLINKDTNVIKELVIYLILDGIKISPEKVNCSFCDILTNKFSPNKLGFTGTPFVHLIGSKLIVNKVVEFGEKSYNWKDINKLEDNEFSSISYQKDANGNMLYSMLNKSCKVISKVNVNQPVIYEQCSSGKYLVLIDTASIFTGVSSKDVIKQIIKNMKVIEYGIYVDNSGIVQLIEKNSENEMQLHQTQLTQDQLKHTFTYFDQGHIVGFDIKLHQDARGLVTVNNSSTFSKVTQGIFRMRNINKTQFVDIICDTNFINGEQNDVKQKYAIVKKIINLELEYQESNYNFFMQQYTKTSNIINYVDYMKEAHVKGINLNDEQSTEIEVEKEQETEKEKEKEKMAEEKGGLPHVTKVDDFLWTNAIKYNLTRKLKCYIRIPSNLPCYDTCIISLSKVLSTFYTPQHEVLKMSVSPINTTQDYLFRYNMYKKASEKSAIHFNTTLDTLFKYEMSKKFVITTNANNILYEHPRGFSNDMWVILMRTMYMFHKIEQSETIMNYELLYLFHTAISNVDDNNFWDEKINILKIKFKDEQMIHNYIIETKNNINHQIRNDTSAKKLFGRFYNKMFGLNNTKGGRSNVRGKKYKLMQ